MSSYHYHLAAIDNILCEPIFRNLFEEQKPVIWFEFTGNLNDYVPENHPHYDIECEKSISGYVYDHTDKQDLEYFELWGPIEPFEYEWWQDITEYFKKNGPLVKIDKKLKDDITKILKYSDGTWVSKPGYMIMAIYEFIIDNYGRYCYHYVY
jgi:hypothetical protein